MQHHGHFASLAPTILSLLGRLWVYLTLGATSISTEEAAPVLQGLAAQRRPRGAVDDGVARASVRVVVAIPTYQRGVCV